MSSRNTFTTRFIYGYDKVVMVEEILFTASGGLHWHGKQDKSAGYFVGRIDTLSEPPYEVVFEVIKKIRHHFADFNMAVVCDDQLITIDAASLKKIGFDLGG